MAKKKLSAKKKLVKAACYAVVRKGRVVAVTRELSQANLWAAWNKENEVVAGRFVPRGEGA